MTTDEDEIQRAARDAFRAVQAKARTELGGNTAPLLTVYAIESFLRRLAMSEYAHAMVLKGGMLMAVNDVRRMTKDADLSTHGVDNDEQHVAQVVAQIARLTPAPHDGIVIDTDTIKTEAMREDAEYHGVRCKLSARLAQARIPFALDFSFGDTGASTIIELPSVIDREAVRLQAYPLTLNLAEKIVTAIQRRDTNTRDRDFADLWVTSRVHELSAGDLRAHIVQVAEHREQPLIPMAEALAEMPDRQQPYSAMLTRMSYLQPAPERYDDMIAEVVAFTDPVLADTSGRLSRWDPSTLRWT